MKSMNIIVAAGPTQEPIDPVRFITNYSTGVMGYSVAAAAHKVGHKVTLVTGPTHLKHPRGVSTIEVVTARDMYKVVKSCFKAADCVVMAAAVSDFRPAQYSAKKIKRADAAHILRLTRNPDILSLLGQHKGDKVLVGFCMETSQLIARARNKMDKKHADLIVANKIDAAKSAFGPGGTSVFIIGPAQQIVELKDMSKGRIARIILEKIEHLWYKNEVNQAAQGTMRK